MRGKWNHKAPKHHQPCPADNTSEHVMRQVKYWYAGQDRGYDIAASILSDVRVINPELAMEIAAWWQAPSNAALTAFASSGTITDGLAEEIDAELARVSGDEWTPKADNEAALRALLAYVRACTVAVWSVGSNHVGYLPEGDAFTSLDYAEAVSVYRDMLEEAPDALTDDATDASGDCSADGPCTDGGMCEFHSLEAEVAAYLADDVPPVVGGRVFREPRELSISLRPDSRPLPTEYWLGKSERQYGEHLDEKG